MLSCSYLNNVKLQNGALIHLAEENNILENSLLMNKINFNGMLSTFIMMDNIQFKLL